MRFYPSIQTKGGSKKKKLTWIFCLTLLFVLTAGCLSAQADMLTIETTCAFCGQLAVYKQIGWFSSDDILPGEGHMAKFECAVCGHKTLMSSSATGPHTGGTATCSQQAVCTVCGYSYGGYADHDLRHHSAQAATCSSVGWEAYETCENCSYTTYKEIPTLAHDTVSHDGQAATCTEVRP